MPRRAFVLCLALVIPAFLIHAQTKDSKVDYKKDLPRILPQAPEKAARSFELHPGLEVELIASEPLIRDPVAMEFDEDGRVYVAEMPEYNQYANKSFKGHGSIKLLEDTNGDGIYDKAHVFVEKIDTPTSVACWDGGIFVGSVPDILYFKDTNGDGKADVRKRIFTGFARDHAGEAMLNSFRWGLDNRFHVSTSLAGGNITPVGKKVKPVVVRGRGFLFDPRTGEFDVTSGGGQHGMSMDDWGRKFVCANSEPIDFLMLDDRYLRRNPFLKAPKPAVNIAPGGKFTKVFRISKIEPWRALRTKLRVEGKFRGSAEGGTPAGFFTGATGVTVYRGHAWPKEYHGNVLVGEVSGNLIYRARLVPNGVGFTALRVDPGNRKKEMLASTDNWFRPVQFAHGPDGNLYVVDMYRELIEGAAFLPPEILKHLNVDGGDKMGRLYRIKAKGTKWKRLPQLSKATTRELVKLLEHPGGWHRDTASRLLYQRQDRAIIGELRKLASSSKLPQGRLHALCTLDGLNALRPEDVLPRLKDDQPEVRAHALRLAETLQSHPGIRKAVASLVDDPQARVRYQLAFSLGSIEGEASLTALHQLTVKTLLDPKLTNDKWMRLALLSSMGNRRAEIFARLLQEKKLLSSSAALDLFRALAEQTGAANHRAEVAMFLKSLSQSASKDKKLYQDLLRRFLAGQSPEVRAELTRGTEQVASFLKDLVADARQVALDAKKAPGTRAEAIRALALASLKEVKPVLTKCLDQRQPQPVQQAALEVAGQFQSDEIARMLLAGWKGLSPSLRTSAAETLFSRPAWVMILLDHVEQKRVARTDLDPARIKLLATHPNKEIQARVKKLFANAGSADRQKVFESYRQSLTLKGDVARGKEVFKKNCAACHRLDGVGESVGADLSAIRDRGAEAVLLNILDPNREVKPLFVSYNIETENGRVLTGMITAETANSLTLRKPDGKTETILRSQIETIRSTGLSFMPEGLEKEIAARSMADLLAYLMTRR